MLVSVIIPNYNHAPYLKQRIDSVLNQSYRDFEVIILDDASTDNSREIIEAYKANPKIAHIVYNEINTGSTFRQWEKGVALSKNEFVWIAESDDYADIHFLENAMAKFMENNSLGLVFCNYYLVDEQGNIKGAAHNYSDEFLKHFAGGKAINGKYFCEQYLFFSCLILNASAVVFKKELFLAADKSYMNLKITGDWRMWVNICYGTQVYFDKKKMDFFRMHDNNVRSKRASLMGAETIKNLIYFLKKTSDKALKETLKNNICKTWVYSFYLNKNFR